MKKFTSVEEMFEDMKKNRSLLDKIILKYEWLRWLIYNAKDVPFDFYRKCKRGWQRAYWGISVEDCWSVDYYLTKVTLKGLKHLKELKHGCPCLDGFNSETDEEFAAMDKEWKRILDTMIWTFEVTEKIQIDNWFLLPDKKLTEKEMAHISKNFHVMTVEEMNRYKEGWLNFQKYYFSLWD